VNPARGVDLPDLELGVKSPSENYCTSEPYFSAYERLIGSAHDCVVLLTDYQTAKRQRPLRLQVLQSRYLEGSQLADKNLCEIARAIRPWLLGHGEDRAKRAFKFLAHINQSDWLAKKLLLLVHEISSAEASIDAIIDSAALDFARSNMRLQREDKPLIPDESLRNLLAIKEVNPRYIGILDQTENWMTDAWGEAGRSPNDREWREMLDGPLNGVIGMSFALKLGASCQARFSPNKPLEWTGPRQISGFRQKARPASQGQR